jgi:tetratricopeptide (TPR) repeat protein
MSDKTWITGEFVETVQLQVVCQTLINKLAPDATEISMEHLEAYGSLDKALQVFYEDSIREVVEKTKDALRQHGETELKEGVLRSWFEKKLITPAQTRGLAYRGTTHTEGLPNEAIDVLDQAHIIREERRGSGRWYELSHDRFIDPILTSNKEWMVQYSGAAKVRQWLEERAARWNKTQDEGVLLSENELAEAERWVKSVEACELGYDPAVMSLMQASRANLKNKQRERELELESARRLARSARRFKWASVGMTLRFLLALATTLIASDQWRKAHANLQLAREREQTAERLQNEALDWAKREYKAKQEAADQAKQAESARQEAATRAEQAEKARREAEKARQEAERTKGQLRGALKKVEDRAREAEVAHQTDRLSREAFRLSRRPESQQDAIEQFNHAIDVYRDTGDRDAQVDSYLNQGQVYRDMGEEERAEDAFNKALQLYRAKPADPVKQATTLNNIGVIYSSSSASSDDGPDDEALATAKTKFYSALTIFRALQDSLGEAATLTNLGDAQLNMSSTDERNRAVEFYEAAGGIYDKIRMDPAHVNDEKATRALLGFMISVASKHALLAQIDETFSTEELFEFYSDALAGYKKLNDKRSMAMVHNKIGEAAEEALESAQGERIEHYKKLVEDNYQQAAELYKQSQDPIGEAGAHIKLGMYYQGLEDEQQWRKAVDEFHRALDIFELIQDRAGQVRAHKLLYQFYAKSSNPDDKAKAVAALVRVGELYASLENIRGQSDTYLKLGSVYESLQDRDKAEKAFKAALDLYENSHDAKSQADIFSEIGSIYAASKDKSGVELAIQRYTQAAGIYQATGSVETLAKTYDRLAEIHSQTPWRLGFANDEAIQWYNKAIHYYETEADIYRSKNGSKDATTKIARVLRSIAIVYRDRLGDKAKALDLFNQSLKLYQDAKNSTGMRTVRNDIANLTNQSVPQSQSKP